VTTSCSGEIDRIDGQGMTVAYFSKLSPFEQFEIRNSMTRDDQLKLDEILKYPEVANLE